MTPCVVVLVPMLGRPHTVAPLRESLAASTDRARLLWICTEGDTDVLDATAGDLRLVVPPRARGDYPAKINAGYRATREPLLFLGACDIRFHPGWLEACEAKVAAGFSVVGTNDLGNARTATGALSTHTLVTRDYADQYGVVDRAGQVLHEGYWHEFCDNELVETAKARGCYAHAADAVVEHLHPTWGKAEPDAMYDKALLRMGQGYGLFKKRRPLWT